MVALRTSRPAAGRPAGCEHGDKLSGQEVLLVWRTRSSIPFAMRCCLGQKARPAYGTANEKAVGPPPTHFQPPSRSPELAPARRSRPNQECSASLCRELYPLKGSWQSLGKNMPMTFPFVLACSERGNLNPPERCKLAGPTNSWNRRTISLSSFLSKLSSLSSANLPGLSSLPKLHESARPPNDNRRHYSAYAENPKVAQKNNIGIRPSCPVRA